ncbi:hypothetical protein H5410_030640 [Solanum commersonii]|uniref:Uncharacterized protein n=1 Tax=Solanum commersonii TaxID=4109 RepID=A0A9J5YJY6_SOLCO|nr:hypothetical protein H5410_030640 [Solanum commersonii]
MEGELADDRFRPPDPSTVMHKPNTSSALQESFSKSTYSSSLATEARRSDESSQKCHQNRSTSAEIRDNTSTAGGNTGCGDLNIEVSSTIHGGIASSGDSTGIPSKKFENLQYEKERHGLSQTQIQYREGKQHVQELGQSSTSKMDEQLIKQ